MVRFRSAGVGLCSLASLLVLACSSEPEGASPLPGGAGAGGSATAGSGTIAGSGPGASGSGGSGVIPGGGAGGSTAGSSVGGAAGGMGGAAGTSGSGGSAAGAGGSGGTGTMPPRPIMIDPNRNGREDLQFSATAADPGAKVWHGNQLATFDGSKKTQAKLVVTMGGIGNGPHTGGVYQYAAGRGFHMLAVDMYNSEGGESNQGKVYLESFSGQDMTNVAEVTEPNSVHGRIKKALAYLVQQDPGADWGYYLDAQGGVRWADVILFGYSYGGQVALAATKYVAPYRVFLTASPTLPNDATWLTTMPNVADMQSCFALNSNGDDAKFAKLTSAGWIGTTQIVMGPEPGYQMLMQPPFMGSHLLQAPGGHTEFCSVAGNRYDVICDFVFDVKK